MKIGKTNVYTWATYKKKFNPTIKVTQDSTLGYVYHIEPTLKSLGFIHTREECDSPCGVFDKPLEFIKQMIAESPDKYTYIIYYVYRHSRGYCKYLEIFYA